MKIKSQISIISLVLIILVVIVSFVIVFGVVSFVIRDKSGEIEESVSVLPVNLKIQEAIVFVNGVSKINVQRETGGGDFDSLYFVFEDEDGKTYVETKSSELEELESEFYSFSPIADFNNIKKISVIPVIKSSLGRDFEEQTSQVLEIPAGLVSWWRFDNNLNDFVGENSGSGIISYDGIERTSISLDGTQLINFGNSDDFDVGGESSSQELGISFWIKTDDDDAEILKKGDSYKVTLEDGNIIFYFGIESRNSNFIVNDNDWHHVAVSMIGTYIDGDLKNSAQISVNADLSSADFLVGQGFEGLLDDLMFFNKSFPHTTASWLYNIQKS